MNLDTTISLPWLARPTTKNLNNEGVGGVGRMETIIMDY